jgi:hypothetical protein
MCNLQNPLGRGIYFDYSDKLQRAQIDTGE